jgi:LysM repeat protein
MTQRSSPSARALAVGALIAGFIVLVLVIATSLGGGSSGSSGHRHGHVSRKASESDHRTPASYVIQSGDTLTSIAHKTGVPVARIQELNPGIDPQILVSGEKLKLR